MQCRQSVFKTRVMSWLTLSIFFVFSVMPPSGFSAVVQTVGADGKITYQTDSDTVWELGSFDQAAGAIWDFDLSRGNLQVNVTGPDKTTWSGTSNIFGGILGLFNPNGIHFTETSKINLTNAGFIGAAMRAVDGTNLNNLKLAGNGYLLNEGKISGGNIALLGGAVENKGLIDAPLNQVTIAGGKAMTVGLSGDNLISVVVDEATDTNVKDFDGHSLSDQIKNSGNVTAHKITLNAKGVDSVFEKAINLRGELKAVDVDTNDRGQLVMMSLDDVYSKAILDASKIYIRANSGDIDMMGITRAKELDEQGASFQIGGTYDVEHSHHDNLDGAITYAANTTVSTNQSDVQNIVVNSGVTLTLGADTTFTADSDANGSGSFTMGSGSSIVGAGHNLTIKASQNSTIAGVSGVNIFDIQESQSASNPTFTSDPTSAAWTNITDFRITSGKLNRFTGSGTALDPYQLYDIYGVQAMKGFSADHFKLHNDIDAYSTATWNAGWGFESIASFNGSLDGQGHVIDGLSIFYSGSDPTGLFASLGGSVSYMGLINVDITGEGNVGALAGYGSGQIEHVFVTGEVNGQNSVGGLVGNLYSGGSISNSYSAAHVTATGQDAGGLVGYLFQANIANSFASGNVDGGTDVGGLVGYFRSQSNSYEIRNSFSTGTVTGTFQYQGLVGLSYSGDASHVVDSYYTDTNFGINGNYEASGATAFYGNSHSVYATWNFTEGGGEWNSFSSYLPHLDYEWSTSITTLTQLQNMNLNLSAAYSLGDNINASVTSHWNSGAGFNPIGYCGTSCGNPGGNTPFTGSLDGQGHEIDGLYMNRPTSDFMSFVMYAQNANIHDLGLTNIDFTARGGVAGLVSISESTTLSRVYTTGHLDASSLGNSVGGLVGMNQSSSSISDSWSSVDITHAISNVGGLVGWNINSDISDSYATGSISVIDTAQSVGGLVGWNSDAGTIRNSYATGDVTAVGTTNAIGGFIGRNYDGGAITGSHATGDVVVDDNASDVGGFVGLNENHASITDSYATGNVTGGNGASYIAGFVGLNVDTSTIARAYSSGSVTVGNNAVNVGGFAGTNAYLGPGNPGTESTITNAYTIGDITVGTNSQYIGGFVGNNWGSVITISYADNYITKGSGTTGVGGFAGSNAATSNGVVWNISKNPTLTGDMHGNPENDSSHLAYGYITRLTEEEMKNGSLFEALSWDLNTIWAATGGSAPDLRMEYNVWSGTGNWSDAGNWSKGALTSLSKVLFNSTSTANSTINAGFAGTIAKLFIDSTYSGTITQSRSLTINGDYLQKAGTVSAGSSTTNVSGNWMKSGGTFNAGTGTLDLNGSGAQTLTSGGTNFYNLTHSGSGTTTQSGNLNVTHDFTNSAGTFTSPVASTFSVGNSFNTPGGIFNRFTGAGNSGSPYSIYDVYGLQGISGHLAAYYILANDIDASGTSNWNSGAGFNPLGDSSTKFTGSFDGDDHVITGLFINRPTTDYVGLFGFANNANLHDVGLTNMNITGQNYTGGLVGQANASTISYAYTTGAVNSGDGVTYIGGLMGYSLSTGAVSHSFSTATITVGNNSQAIGGLVGVNQVNSTISDSYFSGAIITGNGTANTGGLVGYNIQGGTVQSSYSTGSINSGSSSNSVGGLVGNSSPDGLIEDSYATGNVTAGISSQNIGGLVGLNYDHSTVSRSYSTGAVVAGNSSHEIGGLIGYNRDHGTVTDSYTTGSVTVGNSASNVGGFVGLNYDGSSIQRAYSSGNVLVGSASSGIGGFAGTSSYIFGDPDSTPEIINTYTTGNVTTGINSDNVAGSVGLNAGAYFHHNLADNVVTAGAGSTAVGGMIGTNPSGTSNNYWNQSKNPTLTDDVYGNNPSTYTQLTSDQMRDAANFTNFDFSTIWVATGSSRIDLRMEYNVWTGAASNAWSNALNWSKGALTSASKVIFNGTYTADSSVDTGFGGTIKKLFIDTGYTGTITQNKNITITDYLQKGGTFNATDKTITVGGDWTKSGGTFSSGTGKVILNGVGQRIHGSTTFNDLTKSTLTADTLTFDEATTQTILGDLTLSGASGNALSLRSSSSGSVWKLDVQGSVVGAQYDDVKDLDLTNSTKSITFYEWINSGNNKNVTFYSPPPPVVVTPEVQATVDQVVATVSNVTPVVVTSDSNDSLGGGKGTLKADTVSQTNFNSTDSGSDNSLINFASFQQSSADKLKDVSIALGGSGSGGETTKIIVNHSSQTQTNVNSGNSNEVASDSNRLSNRGAGGNGNSSQSNRNSNASSQNQPAEKSQNQTQTPKDESAHSGSVSGNNKSVQTEDKSESGSKNDNSKSGVLKKEETKESGSSDKEQAVSSAKDNDKKVATEGVESDSESEKEKEKNNSREKTNNKVVKNTHSERVENSDREKINSELSVRESDTADVILGLGQKDSSGKEVVKMQSDDPIKSAVNGDKKADGIEAPKSDYEKNSEDRQGSLTDDSKQTDQKSLTEKRSSADLSQSGTRQNQESEKTAELDNFSEKDLSSDGNEKKQALDVVGDAEQNNLSEVKDSSSESSQDGQTSGVGKDVKKEKTSTDESESDKKPAESDFDATKKVESDLIQRAAPVEHVFDKVMQMMSTDVHVTQVELRNGMNNFTADMKEVFKGQDQGVEKFRQMIFNSTSKPLAERAPVQVDFEAPRMMFKTVVGKVKVIASDGTIYDAQANKPLNQGDQVWTADDGKAELESGKGNETVTVQSNSAVNLGTLPAAEEPKSDNKQVASPAAAPQQSLLTIAFGKVSVDIAGIQDKPSFQVETPSGMSGLRG